MLEAVEQTVQEALTPGYHVTELGLLPEDWRVVRIGDLIDSGALWVKNGFAEGTHNSDGQGVPHLRPFNVTTDGRIDLTQIKSVSTPPVESTHWVKCNDVIYNNTNSEELVGKTAFFPHDGQYVLSNHMTIMRVLDANVIDAHWLAYQLLMLWQQGLFRALCRRHVNQASVSLERLKGVRLTLPGIKEQRAIAHVLSTVQRARERTDAVIAATRELKRSLMRHLFTYGPVPVGEIGQVKLKETEIGLVPEEWHVEPMSKVGRTKSGGTPSRERGEYFKGSIPWVKSGELEDGWVQRTEETLTDIGLQESSAKVFPLGTLLVALYGATAGKVGLLGLNAATNQAVCAIFPDPHVASAQYLFYAFIARRRALLAARYGGAQPNISQRTLAHFPLPIPPLYEQQAIVETLAGIDQKLAVEDARAASLDVLYRGVIEELMAGQSRKRRSHAP